MKKFKIKKGFITQKMGDKLTIFDAEESLLYTFNETASYIFNKLKLGWDKQKIIEALVKKYSITREKAKKDYTELMIDLKKKRIISS